MCFSIMQEISGGVALSAHEQKNVCMGVGIPRHRVSVSVSSQRRLVYRATYRSAF